MTPWKLIVPDIDAGSEMDALIAERVFGYEWRKSRNTGKRCIYAPGEAPEHFDTPADMTEPLVHDWDRYNFTPIYSLDMEEAWNVVMRLRERGIRTVVRTDGAISGVPRVEMFGVSPGRGEWMVHAEAATAPLAICRAGLQAVEASAPSTSSEPHAAGDV